MDPFFHPLIDRWFRERFGSPTEPQRLGWPAIASGEDTLIAAPTGSGKTLAAFLHSIDQVVRRGLAGELRDEVHTLYVSPLKALSSDIQRNLEAPLREIQELARAADLELPEIRADVRTGDTPQARRQAMARRPPHILVTTPESLYLVLTSPKSREMLRSVRAVIVDEIHALARDKRGSHLSLSLERLDALAAARPVRVGLSATQRPLETVAAFLTGARELDPTGRPRCRIIDAGHLRDLDIAVEVPPAELSAACSHETWAEIYSLLAARIREARSTLVFVNTRRLAERVAHCLREELGDEAVASHHGSLSRQIRQDAERRLKEGQLKAVVATASLELGIDIGFVDCVLQVGSPRSIATFLQRVGRSGHSLGATPRGRLFPLSRDELVECLALVRAVRAGRLDRLDVPEAPLDILAQQIVAATSVEPWDEQELLALVRRAWPYRDLSARDFEAVLEFLSEGIAPGKTRQGAYLHRDRIYGTLRARRHARIVAVTSGGAIPEMAEYRVVTADDRTVVGAVNEDFAIESMRGDVFLLGNGSWRVEHVRGGEVAVRDARGAPATIPFWLGEAPGRTKELSEEVSRLREDIAARLDATDGSEAAAASWLAAECGASEGGARQAVRYIAAEVAALGVVPADRRVVFERFFDEAGGMHLVVHAPFGTRINRAWGLALRKRFCRSFNFELQASADDDGIVLSLGTQHSFDLERMFHLVRRSHAADVLVQAVLAVPFFTTRWRWNLNRALAVPRQRGGKRMPPHLQRMLSDDLLSLVFPQQTACLEHITGDIEVPDHPLVRQTLHDCLHEAMDLPGWLDVLERFEAGEIEAVARDTREPSPFAYERLNTNPYAFLDGAPLEERRARAVATRRALDTEELRELAQIDPEALARVREEAWPLVRDAEELHDALLSLVALPESEAAEEWRPWFEELAAAGRASRVHPGKGRSGCDPSLWIASENWPLVRAALEGARAEPIPSLPPSLRTEFEGHEGRVALVRGRLECRAVTTAEEIARALFLPRRSVEAALEALEGEGFALRGRWAAAGAGEETVEWCERRLLARIHRLTLEGLRRRIEPVKPEDYVRFLARFSRVHPDHRLEGIDGLWAMVDQLAGFEIPAGSWEADVLPLRITGYDGAWLDELIGTGQAAWGRLRGPGPGGIRVNGPSRRGPSALSRAVPLSIFPREDLPWLARPPADSAGDGASSAARDVLACLADGGALFFDEIARQTGLLPSQVEAGLGELAARGLVTAGSFAAIRPFVSDSATRERHRRTRAREAVRNAHRNGSSENSTRPRLGPGRRPATPASKLARAGPRSARWSRLPPPNPRSQEERHEYWAWLLLRRYGVVFRDLLAREVLAPRWGELARTYRRLEAQGEVRGGRFVLGTGGEQYALEEAVTLLRKVRDEPPAGEWLVVSAADPLNLSGTVMPGPRVPALLGHAVAYRDGRLAASRQGRETVFHAAAEAIDPMERDRLARTLRQSGATRVRADDSPALPS